MYANIIVNISHENLDKTFQYRVPDELSREISVGDYVLVPFGRGNKMINGYVLELTDKCEYDENRIKPVASIVNDSSLVESKLIKLAYWMKDTYGSTMITALKTVLPIKKPVKEKEVKNVVLKLDTDAAYDQLRIYEQKHQTARERLLRELIKEKSLDYSLITGKLHVSTATIRLMQEQGILSVSSERIYRNTISFPGSTKSDTHKDSDIPLRLTLNNEQSQIVENIIADYDKGLHNVNLIHGITGSGKTEVYMEIIEHVVNNGQSVIVLIPEIALTYQTVMRFYKRFGDRVSTLHSKLSQGERYDQFERAKRGEIDVMIGPRSALFTPFENIGLIVIDEEHEGSYKSDSMPKYHAVDVAKKLCELHNATLVLGSATPSLNSYYEAMNGNYKLFTLKKRAKESALAKTYVVDLRDELKNGNRSIFSRSLQSKIEERLRRGEQVMLFLNRRGYAGFVSCRSCGHVMKCPHCDVSLSEHRGGKLICHYCGHEEATVKICPKCGSKLIGGMKAGTEQIEQQIKAVFPYARVLRMDADTTKGKESYEQILSAFANREADILVGTQMIVKGHDFPYVTLVGILAADMSLYANDYRSCERTFQLLTQAAGRAGRDSMPGEVIIQTYNPEHYSIVSSADQDYESFYKEEMAYRNLLGYPPAAHLLSILIESPYEEKADIYATDLAVKIKDDIMCTVIGPADANVKKLKDIYRTVIHVKSRDLDVLKCVKNLAEKQYEVNPDKDVRISFDLDPMNGY